MDGFFAEAFWLAGKEMRRTWLSYPLTGLFALFLGFFVVPSLSGVFEFDGFGVEGRRMEILLQCLLRRLPLPNNLRFPWG